MNQERLKLIVHNLELIVQSLKEEIQDSPLPSISYEEIAPFIEDDDLEYYDETEDV